MKSTVLALVVLSVLASTGCSGEDTATPLHLRKMEEKSKPTFMFWCFRKEIVSVDYHVPDMKTVQVAAYLQNKLKSLSGYVESSYDLENQTLAVSYKSSTIRKMNVEETIALAGFAVNNRPANPKAKIPEGVK